MSASRTEVADSTTPRFKLPGSLRAHGYGLRPETDGDIPFLMQLYASTRAEELAPVPWTQEQKLAFLAQQFAAQRKHYHQALAHCGFWLLEHRGQPIGRLYLQRRPRRLHIVDISLMPAMRDRGLGTAILRALQEAAGAAGCGLGIMVESRNPALRLYRRLGFRQLADNGVYLEMEWVG